MPNKYYPFYKFIFNLYSRIAFLFSTIQVCHKRQENDMKRCEMLLLTVAFNDERLIEKQIEQIRLMIKDSDYQHVVADNSLNRKKRKLIKTAMMDRYRNRDFNASCFALSRRFSCSRR